MQVAISWSEQPRLPIASMRLQICARATALLLILLACAFSSASAHRSLLLDSADGASIDLHQASASIDNGRWEQQMADTMVQRHLLQDTKASQRQVSGGCASILASGVYTPFYRAGKPSGYFDFLQTICSLQASTKAPFNLVLPSPLTGESATPKTG